MGYLNPVKQRAFVRKWVAKRRQEFFAANGPCARCRSWERLELHHREPSEKTSHRIWSWSADRRAVEIAKCDILCRRCHVRESAAQTRARYPWRHGHRSTYKRGCRCAECLRAAVEYNKQHLARRAGSPLLPSPCANSEGENAQ